MSLEQIMQAVLQNGALGGLVALIFMLTKDNQRNYDECNERIERLINTHIDFVRATAHELASLMGRIEHMLDRMEEVIVSAKECVENDR